MKKDAQKLVAQAAARFMVDGLESEYLGAKERAVLMLGLGSQTRLPSNRKVRECIALLTREELGESEVQRRLRQMRLIAEEIMMALSDFDPFLIGSTLSGDIHTTSDVDLHAYCDSSEEIRQHLLEWGFEDVEEEFVENRKGQFVHLRWVERDFPVEVTIYPLCEREVTPYSSVTGKPMKRADLAGLRRLLASTKAAQNQSSEFDINTP
jgi:predicted nucleotidyltransferase